MGADLEEASNGPEMRVLAPALRAAPRNLAANPGSYKIHNWCALVPSLLLIKGTRRKRRVPAPGAAHKQLVPVLLSAEVSDRLSAGQGPDNRGALHGPSTMIL
jgi:hypothetical protein